MMYNLFQENQNLKCSHPLENTKINLKGFHLQLFYIVEWATMFQLLENLLERSQTLTRLPKPGSDYLINSRVTTVGLLSILRQKQKTYIHNARTVTGPLLCETNVYLRQNNNFS